MTKHMTGTRKEWLEARLDLLEAEKELTRRSDELARRRQKLPWVRIDKEYRFDTDEGSASLADLFQRRSQLLVHGGANKEKAPTARPGLGSDYSSVIGGGRNPVRRRATNPKLVIERTRNCYFLDN